MHDLTVRQAMDSVAALTVADKDLMIDLIVRYLGITGEEKKVKAIKVLGDCPQIELLVFKKFIIDGETPTLVSQETGFTPATLRCDLQKILKVVANWSLDPPMWANVRERARLVH